LTNNYSGEDIFRSWNCSSLCLFLTLDYFLATTKSTRSYQNESAQSLFLFS